MQVVLYKKSGSNKTHYYSIDDRQQSLFHPYAITIRWGTSLDGGRERNFYFDSIAEKNKKIRSILKSKLKTYQVLYSYFKKAEKKPATTEDLLSQIS